MVRRNLLVASLVAVAAASLAQGACGGELIAVPFTTVIPLAAAAAVIRTGKPLAGLLVAGWLALGPIFMPYVADDLSDPGNVGLFTSTVAYLVAIGLALLSGAAAQRDYRRGASAARERPGERGTY
jgi:hypothetical protein